MENKTGKPRINSEKNTLKLSKKMQSQIREAHKYRIKEQKKAQRSLVLSMERARLAEYARFYEKPWKLLGINF
mgnify:FL=1